MLHLLQDLVVSGSPTGKGDAKSCSKIGTDASNPPFRRTQARTGANEPPVAQQTVKRKTIVDQMSITANRRFLYLLREERPECYNQPEGIICKEIGNGVYNR